MVEPLPVHASASLARYLDFHALVSKAAEEIPQFAPTRDPLHQLRMLYPLERAEEQGRLSPGNLSLIWEALRGEPDHPLYPALLEYSDRWNLPPPSVASPEASGSAPPAEIPAGRFEPPELPVLPRQVPLPSPSQNGAFRGLLSRLAKVWADSRPLVRCCSRLLGFNTDTSVSALSNILALYSKRNHVSPRDVSLFWLIIDRGCKLPWYSELMAPLTEYCRIYLLPRGSTWTFPPREPPPAEPSAAAAASPPLSSMPPAASFSPVPASIPLAASFSPLSSIPPVPASFSPAPASPPPVPASFSPAPAYTPPAAPLSPLSSTPPVPTPFSPAPASPPLPPALASVLIPSALLSPPRPPTVADDLLVPFACVVCMDAPRERFFLPCCHLCCCQTCASPLQNCPVCRNAIVSRHPVFLT